MSEPVAPEFEHCRRGSLLHCGGAVNVYHRIDLAAASRQPRKSQPHSYGSSTTVEGVRAPSLAQHGTDESAAPPLRGRSPSSSRIVMPRLVPKPIGAVALFGGAFDDPTAVGRNYPRAAAYQLAAALNASVSGAHAFGVFASIPTDTVSCTKR
jgi:hypothetical protein